MAGRVSFFFVTVILCNVLVRGQPPINVIPDPNAAKSPATVSTTPATVPTTPATVPTTLATAPTPLAAATTPGAAPTGTPLVQASPECATLQPKTLEDMPFTTGETIWWVGKLYINASAATAATPAATTPVGTPACTGQNTCSINTYKVDSCQAIKLLISRNEDGSICLKEATFNKVTNSASLVKNTWLPADPSKAIIKQLYGYYGTMDQSGTITIVDPGPPEVKTAQSSDFVLIGAGEGGEWALFSSCCKSVVFVLYNDATVCAKTTKNFDQVITPLLQPLGITPEDLKDIPTDFPIKLDNFIPPLTATPATVGATLVATTPGPIGTSTAAVPPPQTTPTPPPPAATQPPAAPPAGTPPR